MLAVGTLLSALGFGVIYAASKGFKRDRLITDTPTSKARSMAVGRVELYGIALPYEEKKLKTPFGGRDCIWCQWIVETLLPSREHHEKAYVTLKEGVLPGLFYLQDETGKVLVYSRGADVDAKYTQRYDRWKTGDAHDFLVNEGITTENTPTLRLTESYIAPYDKVYVLGTAMINPYKQSLSDRHEDEIVVCKGEDIFYISARPYDKIHEYASGNVSVYLIMGSLMILAGLALILIYP